MSGGREEKEEAEGGVVSLRSAGGVVIKGEGEELRVAVMRSAYGTWVFPKGGVEEGEGLEEAARREVGEEIGLRELTLLGDLGCTVHEFGGGGERYRKRVDWFLFRACGDEELRESPADNSLDCGWFTLKQALSMLSHANQRGLVRRAASRLE